MNPQELEAVAQIREWREADWSLGKIARELTSQCIPTKRGKAWYPGTVKYLLENNFYSRVAVAPEKVYTPEGAAEALMVSLKTIREWLRTWKLKGIKIGRLWRVRESDLDLVEFLKIPPEGGPAA